MARYWFGGGVADWSFGIVTVSGTANLAQVAGGATMTFWTAEVGGSQYTDLLDSDGVAVTVIESADGTVARAAGQIPPLQGPDEVKEMWASANDGPRALMVGRAPDNADTAAIVNALTAARRYPAATDAAIRAAAQALAAGGGGVVMLPAETVTLSSPLPVLQGVTYYGVEPVTEPVNKTDGTYLGDMDWNYVGGTVLVGDGTFAAFEANAVDQGSVSPTIGDTQISNAGIINVGIDNVTYGVRVGAVNIMGMVWGTLRNVYVKGASQWAVQMANFQHCQIDNIRTCASQNGQFYGNLMPKLTLMCGNSTFGELYNYIVHDGRDNRLCRGIVFESGGLNAQLNELTVRRVQANQMYRTKLSVAATVTSGSETIAVPSGVQFAPGMPVVFTTTANGFTAGQGYLVASVAGNTITLANDRASAAIVASGSGSMTIESWGFPCVEVTRRNSGANVRGSRFGQIDVEGFSSAALYVDGAQQCTFDLSEIPAGGLHLGVMGRSAQWCEFNSPNAAPTDFDATCTSSSWWGQRGPIIGRQLSGMWLDAPTGSKVLAVSGGQSGQVGGDLQARAGGFLYPVAPLGERIFPRDSAITLGAFNGGDIVFAGSASQTFTLPTIVSDATPLTSHVGVVFDIYNVGAGTVTVATAGGQVLNRVAGRTSVTVTPGTSLKVVAAKDNGGTLFWLAKANTLVA